MSEFPTVTLHIINSQLTQDQLKDTATAAGLSADTHEYSQSIGIRSDNHAALDTWLAPYISRNDVAAFYNPSHAKFAETNVTLKSHMKLAMNRLVGPNCKDHDCHDDTHHHHDHKHHDHDHDHDHHHHEHHDHKHHDHHDAPSPPNGGGYGGDLHSDAAKPAPVAAITETFYTPTQITHYYNFPNPTASKTIAIISLGGSLKYTGGTKTSVTLNGIKSTVVTGVSLTDVNYNLQTICGLTTLPAITLVLYGETALQGSGDADLENTLDIVMAAASCPSSPTTQTHIIFYQVANTLTGFVNAITLAAAGPYPTGTNKPNTISISWGEDEAAYTSSQLTSFNNAFAAAVAAGINVCVAAGDGGSSDGIGSTTGKYVDFPSSSPNVVACGGTYLLFAHTQYYNNIALKVTTPSETVWGWSNGGGGATGGGVSKVFAQPAYQVGIVPTSQSGTGSAAKRTTPDVALNADPYSAYVIYITTPYYATGSPYLQLVGGTSCAAPLMAGFLASTGTQTAANTHMYSGYTASGSRFLDITSGSNGAYSAAVGYDCCTGLGRPIGNVLGTYLANY